MKSKDKKFDSVSDTISIGKFVNCYLGVDFVDCKNLRHMGLKSLNSPYVVGVSNDFANKNPEYVKNGMVLLVIDSRGDRGSYINPEVLIKLTNNKYNESLKEINSSSIHNLKQLEEFYNQMNLLFDEIRMVENYENFVVEAGKEKEIQRIKKLRSFNI